MGLIKIGTGINRTDRNVVRLGELLVVDCNEKIISDISQIVLELGKCLEVKMDMKSATYVRFDDKQLIHREGSKK